MTPHGDEKLTWFVGAVEASTRSMAGMSCRRIHVTRLAEIVGRFDYLKGVDLWLSIRRQLSCRHVRPSTGPFPIPLNNFPRSQRPFGCPLERTAPCDYRNKEDPFAPHGSPSPPLCIRGFCSLLSFSAVQ